MKSLCKLIVVLGLMPVMFAQSKTASDQPAKKDAAEQEVKQPDSFYKLTFTIFELEDGKRTNQREYSMISRSNDGRPASLRSSTRVPIYAEEKKIQYIDAGLDIRCFAPREIGGKIAANCEVNISNFVVADVNNEARTAAGPVMRTTNANTWAFLTAGKPMVISTIDDVNSKKRIQIEMTATRID
jgi:hypothetical protein